MSDKPKLRLGFTDYYDTLDTFFMDALSEVFDIERDDVNPDYLIFCDETFGTRNKSYDSNKVVKIFFTGENRRPWHYDCHYAISFDHHSAKRYYRLPLYVLDNWVNVNKLNLPDISQYNGLYTMEDVEARVNFCSFVVGNPGCEQRNQAFHLLNQYKPVKSGGPLFNNIGYVLPRGEDAQVHKFDFLRTCKFNLCYENGSHPGYVTEKIAHPLAVGVVPIYWGSPTVELDFNPDSFVNRHNFETDEQMLEHIKQIDEDNDLYLEMINNHPLAINNTRFDLDRFARWFKREVYRG